MYTRNEYVAGQVTHSQYYAQFSTPHVEYVVEQFIGMDRVKKALAAGDEHLNTIPLRLWDRAGMIICNRYLKEKLKEAGDIPTPSGLVCILKETARRLAAK